MLEWKPNPGKQEQFHSSWAFEVFYGGAAGGGKSESGLTEALRFIHVPGYRGILFRRTFPELAQQDGLIDRSRIYYPEVGGEYNKTDHLWTFPSGATIQFGHMEHVADKYKYKSAQFAYAFFDELTSFEEEQYLYIFSRVRTVAEDPLTGKVIPARVRAGSNPGDIGHEWVNKRFREKLQSGEVKYFARIEDVDTEVDPSYPGALSRQYIPSSLYDNPKLMEKDPGYESRLMALPLYEREQLLHGNWDIAAKGNIFQSAWFKTIFYTPDGLSWVRYWDLAASTRTRADFTASGAVAMDSSANIYIRDMYNRKLEWPDAQKLIKEDTLSDLTLTKIGIEKKLHGLAAWQEFMRDKELASRGVKIEAVDVDVDKLSRALAWSGRAEAGKVVLVDGPWIPKFISQAVMFEGTGKTHDDQVDSISGGVKMLGPKKIWRRPRFLHL